MRRFRRFVASTLSLLLLVSSLGRAEDSFSGRFYRGRGDAEYLQLLEIAGRMFTPDPELQNIAMFYMPAWNGLVEGPTWNAWWIQNSYGPTYCMLPFSQEPMLTFLQNSQDLWFDQMGDGKTVRPHENYCAAGQAVPMGSARRLPVRLRQSRPVRRQARRRPDRHSRLGHGVHRRRHASCRPSCC